MSNETDKAPPRPWAVHREDGIITIIFDPMYGPVQDQLIPILKMPQNAVNEARAALIVRAVNSHDKLVEACEMAKAALNPHESYSAAAAAIAWDYVRAALTLAKGEKL